MENPLAVRARKKKGTEIGVAARLAGWLAGIFSFLFFLRVWGAEGAAGRATGLRPPSLHGGTTQSGAVPGGVSGERVPHQVGAPARAQARSRAVRGAMRTSEESGCGRQGKRKEPTEGGELGRSAGDGGGWEGR